MTQHTSPRLFHRSGDFAKRQTREPQAFLRQAAYAHSRHRQEKGKPTLKGNGQTLGALIVPEYSESRSKVLFLIRTAENNCGAGPLYIRRPDYFRLACIGDLSSSTVKWNQFTAQGSVPSTSPNATCIKGAVFLSLDRRHAW